MLLQHSAVEGWGAGGEEPSFSLGMESGSGAPPAPEPIYVFRSHEVEVIALRFQDTDAFYTGYSICLFFFFPRKQSPRCFRHKQRICCLAYDKMKRR